jgi:hypothetical protein
MVLSSGFPDNASSHPAWKAETFGRKAETFGSAVVIAPLRRVHFRLRRWLSIPLPSEARCEENCSDTGWDLHQYDA